MLSLRHGTALMESFFNFWPSPCAAINNILPANEKIQVIGVTCLVEIDCSGRRKKGTDFAHLPPPAGISIWITDREDKFPQIKIFQQKAMLPVKNEIIIVTRINSLMCFCELTFLSIGI